MAARRPSSASVFELLLFGTQPAHLGQPVLEQRKAAGDMANFVALAGEGCGAAQVTRRQAVHLDAEGGERPGQSAARR